MEESGTSVKSFYMDFLLVYIIKAVYERRVFRMDLGEIQLEGVSWFLLSQERDQWQAFVHTIMNFRFP
jgi:hypothetical protein